MFNLYDHQVNLPTGSSISQKLTAINNALLKIASKTHYIPYVQGLPKIDGAEYTIGSKVILIEDNATYIVNKNEQWELYFETPNYYSKAISDTRYQSVLRHRINIKSINGHSILGSGDLVLSLNDLDTSGLMTADEIKSYVADELALLVDSAPETLNTLGELAIAFQNNRDIIEALNSAVADKASKDYVANYVDDAINTAFNELAEMEFGG